MSTESPSVEPPQSPAPAPSPPPAPEPSPGPQPDYATDHPPAVTPPDASIPQHKPEPKPSEPGYDQVDFSLVPEEHRAAFTERFNRLYGQVKSNQRERAEERKFYQNLESKLDTFINSETEQRQLSKIELMGEKAKQLFAEDKHDEGVELLRKIVHAERELVQKREEAAPQKEDKSSFTETEQRYLVNFIKETPWAAVGSPYHQTTKDTISGFLANGMSLTQAVESTREVMEGIFSTPPGNGQSKEATVAQAVLSQSHSVRPPQETKVPLNEYQKAVARKFFSKLPPEEAYKKYAANLD